MQHVQLQDVQSSEETRGIGLAEVGVAGVHVPLQVGLILGQYQPVQAKVSAAVRLNASVRGAHLSRFVDVLLQSREAPLATSNVAELAREVAERQKARGVTFRIDFRFFMNQQTPASGIEAPMLYEAAFIAEGNGEIVPSLYLAVPVTTLCPCSKAISEYGAHNQRAILAVTARLQNGVDMDLGEVVALLEAQGSAPVRTMVKRADEKWLTERAYENAKFVEDVVRDTALALRRAYAFKSVSIRCTSIESIHQHDAYALYSSTEG